jgi:hypothetical protein
MAPPTMAFVLLALEPPLGGKLGLDSELVLVRELVLVPGGEWNQGVGPVHCGEPGHAEPNQGAALVLRVQNYPLSEQKILGHQRRRPRNTTCGGHFIRGGSPLTHHELFSCCDSL